MNIENMETGRHAVTLHLPAGIKWPKEVSDAVTEWDKLYDRWNTEQSGLYKAIDEYEKAQRLDTEAMRAAIAKGLPDPGEEATNAKARAVVFQDEATRLARKNADRQARAVFALVEKHSDKALEQACDIAEAGADRWEKDITELKASYAEAVARRNAAYAALRWVAPLVSEHVRYEPSFPLEGAASWPQTHESRPRGVVELIRKMGAAKVA